MLRYSGLHSLAASPTFKFVIHGVDISGTDLKLKVPVLAQRHGIAVSNACSCKPSLETVVCKRGVVLTEELEVVFDITKIITAITKANEAVTADARMTPMQIKRIAEAVELNCIRMNRAPSVEEIQELVETRIIDGVRYILIRAEEGVEVNGVNVNIQ